MALVTILSIDGHNSLATPRLTGAAMGGRWRDTVFYWDVIVYPLTQGARGGTQIDARYHRNMSEFRRCMRCIADYCIKRDLLDTIRWPAWEARFRLRASETPVD
ncbi:hypothetical protein [Nitrosovibrio sp. Nv6]|uniref:hypothetical protein n=1 Tax=Nitrosovibrio sp. Nv6 TaxID=1855340 RepID=UPI00115F8685|nr:hypothetical protein [Nitrosovibrio sp. Nv6]